MEILKELTGQSGISGNETPLADWLEARLQGSCSDVKINKTGSVTAYLGKFDKNKKTVMLEAHMDRIGLVVAEILENGFVRFRALGGVDERTLPASEVYILGAERVFGIIGALPPHLKGSGADEGTKIEDLMIDTGFSRDELECRISVGDPIILKSQYSELLGDRVSVGALDNRAGISAVLGAAEMLGSGTLEYNIKLAFTVGEELGLLGARCLDVSDVDLCIVVDVTHAETPDAKTEGTFPLNSGAAICRGPNLDFDITNKVIDFAEAHRIPHSIEVAAGNTGTNAWVIQTLEQGIRCVLLSIPIRYMHTSVETAATSDIKSVAELIAGVIKGGGLFA